MATASEGLCHNDPNFAVICNFLDKYGELLGLSDVSYDDLQTWIEGTKHVPVLVDLHVRLLRRMGKGSVTVNRWEKYIIKFCHTYSNVDAWEVERFGYNHSKISTKLTLLKNLLERQFDFNAKFKEKINEKTPDEMRFMPIGRDKNGLAYWYMLDKEMNLRVYREDQDDVDAETWELVCRDRNDLASLIGTLESDINIKTEEKDTTSETSGSIKSEPVTRAGKPKEETSEDSLDSVPEENVQTTAQSTKNRDIKLLLKKEPDKLNNTETWKSDEVDGIVSKKEQDDSKDGIVKCDASVKTEVKNIVKSELKDDSNESQIKEEVHIKSEAKEEVYVNVKEEDIVKQEVKEEVVVKQQKCSEEKECELSQENKEKNCYKEDGGSSERTYDSTDKHLETNNQTKLSNENSDEKIVKSKEDLNIVDTGQIETKEGKQYVSDQAGTKSENKCSATNSECKTGEKIAESKSTESKSENETDDKESASKVDKSKSTNENMVPEKMTDEKESGKNSSKVEGENIDTKCDIQTNNHSQSYEPVISRVNKKEESITNDYNKELTDESTSVPESCPEKSVTKSEMSENKSDGKYRSEIADKDKDKPEGSTEVVSEVEEDKKRSRERNCQTGKDANDKELGKNTENSSSESGNKKEVIGSEMCSKQIESEINDKKEGISPTSNTEIESSKGQNKKEKIDSNEKDSSLSEKVSNKGTIDSSEGNSGDCLQKEHKLDEKTDDSSVKKDHANNDDGTEADKNVDSVNEKSTSQSKACDSLTQKKVNSDLNKVVNDSVKDCETSNNKVEVLASRRSSRLRNAHVKPMPKEGSDKQEQEVAKSSQKEALSKKNESDNKDVIKSDEVDKNIEENNSEAVTNTVSTKNETKTKTVNKNKAGRKRGIEYDDTPDDSPIEPNSKKLKDAKKIVPKGKRKTPSIVPSSSSDSEDIPLSQIGGSRRKVPSKAKKQIITDSPAATRKSSRPIKKKKLESDDDELPIPKTNKSSKSKSRKNPTKLVSSDDENVTVKNKKKDQSRVKSVKKTETSEDETPKKNSKNRSKDMSSEEESEEIDDGRRRSARVKKMRKCKKEPTPEPSSFEEEEEFDSEFHVSSEEDTSDDDFSPKGRNAQRQAARERQMTEDVKERVIPDDTPCCKCQKFDRPEWLLLCDKCDAGYHTACLRPPLMIIPDGDWYCPPCEHKSLVIILNENLKELDVNLKKRERLVKRKERLAFVGISLDNILKEERKENIEPDDYEEEDFDYDSGESRRRHKKPHKNLKQTYTQRSCRQRSNISYKFEEFDEMIDTAIKQEVEEVKEYKKYNYGRSRGKDMANIYEAEGREYIPSDEEKDGKPPPVLSKRKKSRKLTVLDSDEEDPGDESEEFQLSEETENSEPPEDEYEESEDEEDISDYSEDGEGWRSCRRSSKYGRPTRRSGRKRTGASKYRADFVVEDDYDSDDFRRSRRKAARKRVSYHDFGSDEEEEEIEEETEESVDSADLCSDDSEPRSKRSKKLEKKKSKSSDSKRKRVIRSDQESESSSKEKSDEEEDEDKDDEESNSDDSDEKKMVIKKSRKRQHKKRRNSSSEESETESSDDCTRRSKRSVTKKIDFKSLLCSDSDTEGGSEEKKKKKKKKESSSESTECESEEDNKKKKKNVIHDESSETDDYNVSDEETIEKAIEKENKMRALKSKEEGSEVDQEKVDKEFNDQALKSSTENSECEVKKEETCDSESNLTDKENTPDKKATETDVLEATRIECKIDSEVQRTDSSHCSQPERSSPNIARPHPQYSNGHFPQQGPHPGTGGYLGQSVPYGPPQHHQGYYPQIQQGYPNMSQGHQYPPISQNYPQMNVHQSSMGSPPHSQSPQGPIGSPPHGQGHMSSPPHHPNRMSSPPHGQNSQSQMMHHPGQAGPRPGMSSPHQGPPVYTSTYPHQNAPNMRGYHPRMQQQRPPMNPQVSQGHNMGLMGSPSHPQGPMVAGHSQDPQSMHPLPNSMGYPAHRMRHPVPNNISDSRMNQMGFQGAVRQQGQMLPPGQMGPQRQMAPSGPRGQIGPLMSLGQMIPPGSQGQHMSSPPGNVPPSSSPGSIPNTSVSSSNMPKVGAKRGRPKGSKSKKNTENPQAVSSSSGPIQSPPQSIGGSSPQQNQIASPQQVPSLPQNTQLSSQSGSMPSSQSQHGPPIMSHSQPRPMGPSPHGPLPPYPPSVRPTYHPSSHPPMMGSSSSQVGSNQMNIANSHHNIGSPPGMGQSMSSHGQQSSNQIPYPGPPYHPYNMNGGPSPGSNHIGPAGGGRGFMIDTLLEKPQKVTAPSSFNNPEEGRSSEDSGGRLCDTVEEESGEVGNPQLERIDYSSTPYPEEEEGEGVSDIADIVKCFRA